MGTHLLLKQRHLDPFDLLGPAFYFRLRVPLIQKQGQQQGERQRLRKLKSIL